MTRTGIGYDAHRLVEGRRLVIGGVEIEGVERGLAGHSDADVLTHAAIDALLGAAGLVDIGQHFPDTDPRWRGADSLDLLRRAGAAIGERGWRVCNLDASVVCEAPKLAAHRHAMRAALAGALGVAADAVNVKFTTNEGMGFAGRSEGVAAVAVASVERAEPAPEGS